MMGTIASNDPGVCQFVARAGCANTAYNNKTTTTTTTTTG